MRPARKEEPAGEEAGRKEKKGIASLRSRSNIDDSEMNSKQERQGNQSAASVFVLVGKANGYEAIAMTLRTPSPRPVRLIAEASRHPDRNKARPRSHHHPIAFHRPAVFSSTPHRSSSIRYSSPSRSSSRPISSRMASRHYLYRLVSIHAVFVIPSRRVLLIGSCSPPPHRPA